jgi:hypothetical protein
MFSHVKRYYATLVAMKHDHLARKKTSRLLLDWVSLPEPLRDDLLDYLLRIYPDVFGCFAHDRTALREVVENVGRYLRMSWKSTIPREREWFVFTARQEYVRALLGTFRLLSTDQDGTTTVILSGADSRTVARRSIPGVPPATSFDNVADYVRSMAYCSNPKCDERYFFRGLKHEKYCDPCKREVELAGKLKWWHKSGKKKRAKNRKAS